MKKFKSRKKRKRLYAEKYDNVYVAKFSSCPFIIRRRHMNFIFQFEGIKHARIRRVFNRVMRMRNERLKLGYWKPL